MPIIIVSQTAQLQQVDDFPADCERTVKGALYIRPGGTLVVSDGEAAHLKSRGIKYSVAGESKPKVTAPNDPAAAPTAPAPAPKSLPGLPVTPLSGGASGGSQSGSEQK